MSAMKEYILEDGKNWTVMAGATADRNETQIYRLTATKAGEAVADLPALTFWAIYEGDRLHARGQRTSFQAPATFAWVSLCRLCGCNHKATIMRKGRSVFVQDPSNKTRSYRIDAAKFDAGQRQYRDGWSIERWGSKAERTAESESDWQT